MTRAPKGSAVFEVVSEEQYSGVVLDRMLAKGSNIASGLVQYELDGVPSKLTYGPKDLQVGHLCILSMFDSCTLPASQCLIMHACVGRAYDGWHSHAWQQGTVLLVAGCEPDAPLKTRKNDWMEGNRSVSLEHTRHRRLVFLSTRMKWLDGRR